MHWIHDLLAVLTTILIPIYTRQYLSVQAKHEHEAFFQNASSTEVLKPKVFIISLFDSEGAGWYHIPEFNLLARNISISGFPLWLNLSAYAGSGEINAALTVTSLLHSSLFDLTTTYFLIAGIAGVSPKLATIGSVTFARFAVQVGLQYEFDAREMPAEFPTGYVPQGSSAPSEYPKTLYETEVFEVNDALRKRAVAFAKTAQLNDTPAAQAHRAQYSTTPSYAVGAAPPSVVECDTATSDTFWTGTMLAEAFENTTALFTRGEGVYCTSQQEDNAILAALMRGELWGAVQFSRAIVMRVASDFDRPYEGQSAADNLFVSEHVGFAPALRNVYLAGVKVVKGIIDGWEETFKGGVPPTNYMGGMSRTIINEDTDQQVLNVT